MRIVIARHGRPLLGLPTRIRTKEIPMWLRDYNAAGIDPALPPSDVLKQLAQESQVAICSHLPRAIQSADMLGLSPSISPMHRELDLPYRCFPSPPMSPYLWVALFRLAWFFGFSANGESFRTGKQRVKEATRVLIQQAEQHQNIIFVGHGILNSMICQQLRHQGWVSTTPTNWHEYWAHAVFEKQAK